MIFTKNKLVFIVNLIRRDFLPWEFSIYELFLSRLGMHDKHISKYVANFHVSLWSLWFKKLLFSDSFRQFLSQQKRAFADGSHNVTSNPQLSRKIFRKKVSLFLQLHMKNFLFVKITAPPITTTRRVFYPLVFFILYYLEKLRSCYINWIHFTYHVDCLYTLFIYRFSRKLIAKSRNVIDNVQRAIFFYQRNREVDKKQSVAKKRILRKNFKQHFMSALL